MLNEEVRMCLSTVYIDSGKGEEEVMRDVAEMEAEGEGFNLFNLMGEKRFVKGRIKRVDFVDEHTVVMEKEVRL
jgi:predicted RNA-binding protein